MTEVSHQLYPLRLFVVGLWVLVFSVACLTRPAQAESWRNWHIAETGQGHSPQEVEEARSEGVNAGVTDPESGTTLGMGCWSLSSDGNEVVYADLERKIWLAGNLEDLSTMEPLVARFDDKDEIDLGSFGFLSGAFTGKVGPDVLGKMFLHQTMTVTTHDGRFTRKFSLEGAEERILNIRCWQRRKP